MQINRYQIFFFFFSVRASDTKKNQPWLGFVIIEGILKKKCFPQPCREALLTLWNDLPVVMFPALALQITHQKSTSSLKDSTFNKTTPSPGEQSVHGYP